MFRKGVKCNLEKDKGVEGERMEAKEVEVEVVVVSLMAAIEVSAIVYI